jgi:hypothetical protein
MANAYRDDCKPFSLGAGAPVNAKLQEPKTGGRIMQARGEISDPGGNLRPCSLGSTLPEA